MIIQLKVSQNLDHRLTYADLDTDLDEINEAVQKIFYCFLEIKIRSPSYCCAQLLEKGWTNLFLFFLKNDSIF